MIYVLIFISLTLASIAAFQFLYLFFLERVEMEHKKKIRELERHCKQLTQKLQTAEMQIAEQSEIINSVVGSDDEVWADVIEER
jgi:uncharacterized membrane protein